MSKRTGWTNKMSATAREEVARLGEYLRVARERRGLSAAELARRMGVDPRTVSRLESADPTSSLGLLLQALDVLGVAAGFAEIIAPEHDRDAALAEVQRVRRRRWGPKPISDDDVAF